MTFIAGHADRLSGATAIATPTLDKGLDEAETTSGDPGRAGH
jgi:hypothetical protein